MRRQSLQSQFWQPLSPIQWIPNLRTSEIHLPCIRTAQSAWSVPWIHEHCEKCAPTDIWCTRIRSDWHICQTWWNDLIDKNLSRALLQTMNPRSFTRHVASLCLYNVASFKGFALLTAQHFHHLTSYMAHILSFVFVCLAFQGFCNSLGVLQRMSQWTWPDMAQLPTGLRMSASIGLSRLRNSKEISATSFHTWQHFATVWLRNGELRVSARSCRKVAWQANESNNSFIASYWVLLGYFLSDQIISPSHHISPYLTSILTCRHPMLPPYAGTWAALSSFTRGQWKIAPQMAVRVAR